MLIKVNLLHKVLKRVTMHWGGGGQESQKMSDVIYGCWQNPNPIIFRDDKKQGVNICFTEL